MNKSYRTDRRTTLNECLQLGGVVLFIAFVVFIFFVVPALVSEEAPCSTYSENAVKDIPARCISYFNNEGK